MLLAVVDCGAASGEALCVRLGMGVPFPLARVFEPGPAAEHVHSPYTGGYNSLAELRKGADAVAMAAPCSAEHPEACGAPNAAASLAEYAAMDPATRAAAIDATVKELRAARAAFAKADDATGDVVVAKAEEKFEVEVAARRAQKLMRAAQRWLETHDASEFNPEYQPDS